MYLWLLDTNLTCAESGMEMEIFMTRNKTLGAHIVVILCTMLVLILAVFRCRNAIGGELQVQVKENLRDVAMQNVLTLESEIEDKQNLLNSIAEQLKTDGVKKPDEILTKLEPLTEIYHFKRIGFVFPNGKAYTTDGYHQDLSFREFFKKGMQGHSFITGVMTDSIGKEEKINVFSTPVYSIGNEEIAGVLFATYRTKMFEELMAVDSFGGEGYNYIVQSDGTVIAGSPHSTMRVQRNLLSYMKQVDSENAAVAKKLRHAMKNGKTGTVSFKLDDENYVYYMPLHYSFNNQPCYMLTIVPAAVLTERLSPVLRFINIMLTTILIVLCVAAFCYLYTYRKGRMELWRLAYEDSLTKGDNYACFALKMKNKAGIPGYLISMDLSEFKIVNNTCGVEMGDETLRNVWMILRKSLKQQELAARINADHFVLFLMEDRQELLLVRLEQITKMISALPEELNIPRMSVYFGIYPMTGQESVEVAYGRANEAKHLVKGRRDTNYAFYDEVDFQKAMSDKELEDRFEDAIANQEFEIWYQPKYSADSAHIVGAEALSRWRNSDGSLIPPYKFIPLFEKNGMISILDEYVFRAVCRQQKCWEREGRPLLPVSVNISRASLYYSNVVEKYKNILEEYHIEAKYVPLEITESATIDNLEIRDLIDQFHSAGFPLLLDDFGNGYSSLATLNVMHFDILKLDKSLIDYIGDEKGEKLLYYTIKLAKSLGMEITAEGVEHQEQVVFLQRLKCNDIQGFYFSRPLPLEDYQDKIAMAEG